jgi:guanylate kinase
MKKKFSKKRVLVISGPTGSGESTLTNELIKGHPIFKRLVTATTRKPRKGEKNGVDYYFIPRKKFLSEIKENNIIEHTYIKNRDTYYGSYKFDLDTKLKRGFNIIVNPNVIGTKYFKKNYGAVTIFIEPESIISLRKRLKKREPMMLSGELEKRIENARQEIKTEKKYYDYIVTNKDGKLRKALDEIIKILKRENYNLY